MGRPTDENLASAARELRLVGAIDENDEVTKIGELAVKLDIQPNVARLIRKGIEDGLSVAPLIWKGIEDGLSEAAITIAALSTVDYSLIWHGVTNQQKEYSDKMRDQLI